mmetsp:Transcript_9123/g.27323  ORF Transcript_9123/g.27323 Transcript_9123/m.27323 type:complete len:336 (-) Transcript_9123:30-1037(-)
MVETRSARSPAKPRAKSPAKRAKSPAKPRARSPAKPRAKSPARKPKGKKASLLSVVAAAGRRALGGGVPGAIAMVLQVVLLMWLRTTINYQMRNGGSLLGVMATLYAEGGIARFYSGVGLALFQGPLSRFGDTAANAGVLAVLEGSGVPVALQTVCASAAAASWRFIIAPLDTAKTMMQVEGVKGLEVLAQKVRRNGAGQLWGGAVGSMAATFLGHYPWFATNNLLEARVPPAPRGARTLLRRAAIGFSSSVVADFCSNSMRVVKTFVQTSDAPVSYLEAAAFIYKNEGIGGLLWRGLAAKILCNGLGSILFSVAWKWLVDYFEARKKAAAKKKR